MTLRSIRSLVLAVVLLVGIAGLACGSGKAEPARGATTTSATAAPPGPSDVSTTQDQGTSQPPAASEAPGRSSYDPTLMMYAKFPGLGPSFGPSPESTLGALKEIELNRDLSQVRVLVEVLGFVSPEERRDVASTLRKLTGQDFGPNQWNEWMEWLGKHPSEYRPPEGYATWKINLMAQLNRRFALLLRTAGDTARIDLTEVVWGGVSPDGIPDLRNPEAIAAEQADYLGPDERVFGVSINGQHRAYPLRITNPHEMVNDVLGGEPIALAW